MRIVQSASPPIEKQAAAPSPSVRLIWVDLIKGIALIWIFLNHVSEQIFGGPYFGNPYAGWAPLSERFAQIIPVSGYGLLDLPMNLLRYVGWTGDQGVQLFLILSGFGLTWSLLQRQGERPLRLVEFYRKRASRIYPLYWGAHVLFIALFFVIGWGIPLTDRNLYFSLLGIRLTPGQLYYFSPSWWYVTLLIQLYLVFPLLWLGLKRFGATRLLIAACALAFIARAVGLELFGSYIDPWQRGAIFITQLPSFVFGMAFAAWLRENPARLAEWMRSGRSICCSPPSTRLGCCCRSRCWAWRSRPS